MALHSLRLRRSLSVLSTFYRYAAVSSQTRHSIFCPSAPSVSKSPAMISSHWPLRLSSIASYSRSSFARKKEPDKLILEGCDYNHWLITMDFKDSKPTPEEMVRTYEETCAKGLNISVEEAKQKMYACSTTLYQGFQAVMTEEESDKFRDLPGVEFVLPDAYIDPEKKEYGGDKYINGTIIPRPPPTQYGGRQEPIDRNGNPDQPRNERPPRTAPNSQGNSSFNQRGCMQGDGRHFRASENYLPQRPPKNYIPVRPGERRVHSPMNTSAPEGRDSYQGGRVPMPPHQGNYSRRGQGSYNHDLQGNYRPLGEQRDVFPVVQGNFDSGFTSQLGERRDHSPMNTYAPQGRDSYQGGRGLMPSHRGNYNQRGQGSYNHDVQGSYQPQGEQRDYMFPLVQGNFDSGFTLRPGERRDCSPMNTYAFEGRDSYQGGRGLMSSHQGNYNQGGQGSYNHDVQRNYQPQGEQRDYVSPLVQGNFDSGFTWLGERRDCSPINTYAYEGRDSYQGGTGLMPSHRGNYNQKGQGSYNHDVQENYQPQGEQRDYVFPLGQGNFDSGFTTGLGERRDHSPMNTYAPEGGDSYHEGRGLMPSHRGNYNQREQGSYNHDVQGNYWPQGEQGDYAPPPGQVNFGGGFTPWFGEMKDHLPVNNYALEGRDSYHGGRNPMPFHQGNYSQREHGSYNHDVQENYQPQREQRDCVPPPGQGNYGSGFNPTQGGPYVLGGYRGHGAGTPYGQGQSHGSYPNFIEGKKISLGDQRNMHEEQLNYNQRVQVSYDMPPLGKGIFGSGFTSGLEERRDHSLTNTYAPLGGDSYQGGRCPMPSHQVNYNQR